MLYGATFLQLYLLSRTLNLLEKGNTSNSNELGVTQLIYFLYHTFYAHIKFNEGIYNYVSTCTGIIATIF